MAVPLSTSSFERPIPAQAWRNLALTAAAVALVATIAWEVRARALGYAPCLNDTMDLWAQRREAVQPDSAVIIGDSRALFDLDLDQLQAGLGQRPIQLAIVGSCAFPILADLAADENFHGTVICSLLPTMFLVPAGPPLQKSITAIEHFHHRTLAQKSGHYLGMWLEEHVAFLKQEDLTLEALLKQLPIPDRPGAGGPRLPPYFQVTDRERRTRMADQCVLPGPLQARVKSGWLPLFSPPPPPSFVPIDAFMAQMGKLIEDRFQDTGTAVKKIRARGGKVVFVRFPFTGDLKKLEDKNTPREGPWNRFLKESGAPGIYFEDYPELASFDCPEWSHLSGPDSVEFTKRLVPHLQQALLQ